MRATCLAFAALLGACGNDATYPGGGGTLELVTKTAGAEPDHDGYTVMVDGAALGAIGPNDRLAVPGIEAGTHTVELAQIQFNCATLGAFTRAVSVTADGPASVNYDVQCDARSRARIAFVSSNKILTMNADGSGITNLTEELGAVPVPGYSRAPVAWSGDGKRVAFTRMNGALYAANADGSSAIQLAPRGFSPVFSRDAQKVAFMVNDVPPESGTGFWNSLNVANGDGSGFTRLTDFTEMQIFDLSADGAVIAYERYITNSRIFVMRSDGTGVREVANPGACCKQMPSLSPDGSRVAYYAYPEPQDGVAGYEIFVSPTDGSGPPVNVSNNPGDDWSPEWSPDGSRIAFINGEPGAFFNPGRLKVVNVDGFGQLTVTPADNVWEPSWSPDGTRIAYSAADGQLYVANTDGSGRAPVASNGGQSTWTGR